MIWKLLRKMIIDKAQRLDYKNKVILAPMVRVGTLPTRLLALEMGVDIVYTEELIDLRLIKCKRLVNEALGTIDFVDPTDGTVTFRTCDVEKSRVVLQIGTSDAKRALAVGLKVQHDIAGLDVNMGCPKEFSLKGGMGAALLANPDKAANILKTLVDGLQIPVTCKIRILPDINDTIELVKKLASTGIAAIGIHCRTRDERPQHEPHPDVIKELVKHIDIPVICNGGSRDIQKYDDIIKFRDRCGASSVMVARSAQMNVSIFRKEGKRCKKFEPVIKEVSLGFLPMDELIVKYLKLSVDYDNPPHNTKYGVQSILREQQETPRGKKFLQSQTMQQICDIWGLGDYCHQKELELHDKSNFGRRKVVPGQVSDSDVLETVAKKAKTEDRDIIEENIAFLRSNYNMNVDKFPKTLLYEHSNKHDNLQPVYETEGKDKLFRSICSYKGKRYRSTFWQKNKKQAEQAAALVCLKNIGVVSIEELCKNGSILR